MRISLTRYHSKQLDISPADYKHALDGQVPKTHLEWQFTYRISRKCPDHDSCEAFIERCNSLLSDKFSQYISKAIWVFSWRSCKRQNTLAKLYGSHKY